MKGVQDMKKILMEAVMYIGAAIVLFIFMAGLATAYHTGNTAMCLATIIITILLMVLLGKYSERIES